MLELRPLKPEDRPALAAILDATGAFTTEEIAVALELIDDRLAGGTHYRFIVAGDRGVAGYACFGPAPMTDGVWDLYWLAVAPERKSAGIGRILLSAAEGEARDAGGRMMLVETASKPSYANARRFYESAGYAEVARITDYYRAGDDKIVYRKTL